MRSSTPKFRFSLGMEARFARGPLGLDNSGISHFQVAPDLRQPFGHRHQQQEEVYVLVGGSARAKLGDEVVELETWDAVRVPPETPRAFEAGPEGFEMIVFGAPNTENRDAEVIPNWWTD